MKLALRSCPVKTPAWVYAQQASDVCRAAQLLQYPLFVKHHSGYNSISLTKDSKCSNEEQLQRQVWQWVEHCVGALHGSGWSSV